MDMRSRFVLRITGVGGDTSTALSTAELDPSACVGINSKETSYLFQYFQVLLNHPQPQLHLLQMRTKTQYRTPDPYLPI